jgi:hypothetical protein
MSQRPISWAVLLPSVFAAVVIGFVLGAVILEGPMTLIGEEPAQPHLGRQALFAVGIPWNLLSVLIFVVLVFFTPFFYLEGGHAFQDFLWDCVIVLSPFINGSILYVVGRSIDRRRRSPGTQP